MTHNSRAFLALTVLAGLAASFLPATRAAMMAIDLGSEFLKISILKPGRIPISIVNNEMSKRKTPVAIAFVDKHRLVGDEAAALAARYPDRVITRLRDLLGKSYDDPELVRMFSDSHLAYSLVRAPNRTAGAAAIQTHTGEIYSAEELVASVLEYAKALATTAADGDPVTECVLVVPAFFSPAQRQALLDAASLAGLNVLSLVHAHAAAALQYGIERDFANATQDVLFYDLGFGTAQAALVRFSTYGTGASAMQQLEVLDVAWVETRAGGDAMEAALIKHFAAQHSEPTAVLESPRAVARLRKQVKRTKEILSANTEAPISVEEMLPGVDFRGKISREEFEHALAAVGVWERAAAPVATILQRNNVTGADLAAVELLGGTSRVPRVKAALTEALGGRALDM
jgi:hypoxia up-regulated 1